MLRHESYQLRSKRYSPCVCVPCDLTVFCYNTSCNRQYQPSDVVYCVGRRWKSDERGKVTWVLFRLVLASLPISSASAAKRRRRRSLMRSPMRCRTGSPCKNSIENPGASAPGFFCRKNRCFPRALHSPQHRSAQKTAAAAGGTGKMTNGCEFQLNVTFFVICPLRFIYFSCILAL